MLTPFRAENYLAIVVISFYVEIEIDGLAMMSTAKSYHLSD